MRAIGRMLAAMSSLASAGLHTNALAPATIAFYATAATVIPVLFLAIAVQENLFEEMIRVGDAPAQATRPGKWLSLTMLRLAAAFLILIAGTGAEGTALFELCVGNDLLFTRFYVLVALMLLVVAVAYTPFVRLANVAADIFVLPFVGDPEPMPDQPASGQSPGQQPFETDGQTGQDGPA
jgi:hypothetical protein